MTYNRFKIVFFGFIIIFLLIYLNFHPSSASLTPIVEVNVQSHTVALSTSIIIKIIIIDDNPEKFELLRNNTPLESGKIKSNILQFIRTEAVGIWNFTIIVTDFSGNIGKTSFVVAVEDIPITATATDTTTSGVTTATETSFEAGGVPGFAFLMLIVSLTVFLIYTKKTKERD